MAIVDEVDLAVPSRSETMGRRHTLRAGLRAVVDALMAGMAASAEYRQLRQMSESQLRRRGLSGMDIPRHLHQRHFAHLGSQRDGTN